MGKQVIKENKHITAIFDSKALYDQHKNELPQNVVAFVKSLPPDPIKECDLSNPNAWWIKLGGSSGLIIQGGTNNVNARVQFPIAFSQMPLFVLATLQRDDYEPAQTYDYTTTHFFLYQRYSDRTACWLAVGL